MELKWLEDFLSLAETGNFSRAAAERHITQPAFSRHIRSLEEWVGAPLINRATFPATLTPIGCTFLDVAKHAVCTLKEFREETSLEIGGNSPDIKISAANTLLQYFLPELLASDPMLMKSFRFAIKTQNYYEMFDDLLRGRNDFVIQFASKKIAALFDPRPFCSQRIAQMNLLLVSKANSHGRPVYSLNGTPPRTPVPLLGYSDDGFFHKLTSYIQSQDAWRDYAFATTIVSPTCEVLKSFMLAGKGVAWLPKCCIEKELGSGQVIVEPLAQAVESLDVVVYRSKENRRPAAERLWRHFREM